jgi:GT2 family glycosyltransferase
MLSVIVLNWNGKHHLDCCLRSLARQTYDDLEIILVDNGSTDGSVSYVRAHFPWVQVVALSTNQGFCAGNNVGIRAARGEYIALLNNDTEVDEAWAGEMVRVFEQHPTVGFCASKMLLFDQRTIIDSAGDYYSISGAGGKRGRLEPATRYTEPAEVFGACGGAAVYRRALLDDVGLLDEDFFLIFEDLDLSFRAQLKGYRCRYVPTAIVYHKVNATMGTYSHTYVYYGHRNLVLTFVKNMPYPLLVQGLPAHLLHTAMGLAFFATRGRLASFIQAKRDAFGALGVTLQKRTSIQQQRRVSLDAIAGMMTRDWIGPRWREKLLQPFRRNSARTPLP